MPILPYTCSLLEIKGNQSVYSFDRNEEHYEVSVPFNAARIGGAFKCTAGDVILTIPVSFEAMRIDEADARHRFAVKHDLPDSFIMNQALPTVDKISIRTTIEDRFINEISNALSIEPERFDTIYDKCKMQNWNSMAIASMLAEDRSEIWQIRCAIQEVKEKIEWE